MNYFERHDAWEHSYKIAAFFKSWVLVPPYRHSEYVAPYSIRGAR